MSKTLSITWLSSCPVCECETAKVETERGIGCRLYTGDKVTCAGCGHSGEIESIDHEVVDAAWNEVPADGQ